MVYKGKKLRREDVELERIWNCEKDELSRNLPDATAQRIFLPGQSR